MRALSSSELLHVWEQGLNLSAVDRALILLGVACQGSPDEDPARCSLGERDARLLTLREQTFGPEIAAVAHCPKCAAALELSFSTAGVRAGATNNPQDGLTVEDGDYRVEFRLPTSLDLRAVQQGSANPDDAQFPFLQRCLLEATFRGKKVVAEQLPDATVAAISERMAEADPQAEVELPLECFQCGHQWQERFDIDSFFWAEIHGWASRTLNDVHQLASAYGWSETEILGLSPLRRSLYLNLIAE